MTMSADVLAWEDAPAVVTVSVLWLPLLVLTVLLLVQPGVVLHRPVVDLSSLSVTPSWGLMRSLLLQLRSCSK